MTTATFLPRFDQLVAMAGKHLDPLLESFWEKFPCPPPWKPSLLEEVNWTGCVGESVGHQLKLFMVDKCRIDLMLDGVSNGDDDAGEEMAHNPCDISCKVMVTMACLLVSICFTAGIIYFCCRRATMKARATDRDSQESVQSEQTDVRPYSSCHYASAPVVDGTGEDIPGMHLSNLVINQPIRDCNPSFFSSTDLWQQSCQTPMCRNIDMMHRQLPALPHISDDASHYYTESSHPYEYIDDSDSVGDRRFNNSRDGHHFCMCDYTESASSGSNNSDPDALRIPLRSSQRRSASHEPHAHRSYIVRPNSFDLNSVIPLPLTERTSRHIFHEDVNDSGNCLPAGDRRCISFVPSSGSEIPCYACGIPSSGVMPTGGIAYSTGRMPYSSSAIPSSSSQIAFSSSAIPSSRSQIPCSSNRIPSGSTIPSSDSRTAHRQAGSRNYCSHYDDEFRDFDMRVGENDNVGVGDTRPPRTHNIVDEFLLLDRGVDNTHRRSVNLLPAQYL